MALKYYDILNIITKCASQNNSKAPQQSQGSQAMMAAAQAAKPSGEPMLNLLNYGQEEEDNNTQEDSANLKELERLKEENIKLREDISKKEIEMYQSQAQTQILNKEKESLDRIQKQKYDLQKMQVNADAEKIKHQAELEKITAAEELKAQQAVSKQLIDLNKQYTDQKIKNDQALRQQSDRILEQTRKQIEQEREKFNQERTGLSPALKTDLEAAIQALDKIPIPGQDISLRKSAFNTQQYVDALKNSIEQSKLIPQEVKSFIQGLDPSKDMSQSLYSVLNMLRNNPEALREGVRILNDNLPPMWTSFVDKDTITQITNGAIIFNSDGGFFQKAQFNESYLKQNKGNAGQVAQSTGQSIQNQQSSQNIQTGNQPTPYSQSLGRNNSTPQVAGTQNNTQALGQQNNNGQQSTSTVQGRGKFSETLESGLMTFGPIATALTGIPLLFQNKQQSMHTSDLASNSPSTMLESFEHTYKDPRITRRNPSMGSVSSYTPGASLLRQHMVANNSNP